MGRTMLILGADKRPDVFGVVDVGTSKTVCLIVAAPRRSLWLRRGPRALGFGHTPTRGLKAGVVIDPDRAEQSVRTALTQAERAAMTTAGGIYVAVSCGRMRSTFFAADTRVRQRRVAQPDIDKLLTAGCNYAQRDGRKLLHLNFVNYRLDGAPCAGNPLGLAGSDLSGELHAITADDGPVSSLQYIVERAGRPAIGVAPAPHASGIASATQDERQQGVICDDLGAGTTTLSMFAAGRLVAVDTLAVGGHHVTFDIARTLSTPFEEAERIKVLYGRLGAAASEDQGLVAYTRAGEEEPTLRQTTKAQLHDIISTRVADLLAHVVERMARMGTARSAGHRVVLTGGASQLPGLCELAGSVLARHVRIACPQPAFALASEHCKPGFAAAIGLASIALDPDAGMPIASTTGNQQMPGQFMRSGQLQWNGV
jgi:cell division protein FtsA